MLKFDRFLLVQRCCLSWLPSAAGQWVTVAALEVCGVLKYDDGAAASEQLLGCVRPKVVHKCIGLFLTTNDSGFIQQAQWAS